MNIFITNDSGPMHIAAALKVPMIAIFGPTNIKETAPYVPQVSNTNLSIEDSIMYSPYHSCILLYKSLPCAPCKKRECPLKHHNCMKLITPQEVITHTINLLKNNEKG